MALLWPVWCLAWWLQYGHMTERPSTWNERAGRVTVLPVPAWLAPTPISTEVFFSGTWTEQRTPEWGCTQNGTHAPYWQPNRLLLWLFLRWPIECEAMHGLQACDLDRCDGVRAEYIAPKPEDPEDISVSLVVRCDEFGYAFGPNYIAEYECTVPTNGWMFCTRVRPFYRNSLHPCGRQNMKEDVPCATEEMKLARKYWTRDRSCVFEAKPKAEP